eukprot:RCo045999
MKVPSEVCPTASKLQPHLSSPTAEQTTPTSVSQLCRPPFLFVSRTGDLKREERSGEGGLMHEMEKKLCGEAPVETERGGYWIGTSEAHRFAEAKECISTPPSLPGAVALLSLTGSPFSR